MPNTLHRQVAKCGHKRPKARRRPLPKTRRELQRFYVATAFKIDIALRFLRFDGDHATDLLVERELHIDEVPGLRGELTYAKAVKVCRDPHELLALEVRL